MHAPVKNVDKDIIEQQVAHRRNDHGNHGKLGFPFGTDNGVSHHTKGQKGHSVQNDGIIYDSTQQLWIPQKVQLPMTLDTLTDAYSTIVYLQAALDDLRKKNLIAEQNNVKAYRQNKKLKQKFSKFV